MSDEITRAVVEALGSPIANGTARAKQARSRRRELLERRNGPVVVARKPVGEWECDSCGEEGEGWREMRSHAKETNHRTFTGAAA